MEFILEQQAALTAGHQQLQGELAQLEKVSARHSRELEVHTEWKTEMSRALQELATQTKDAFLLMAGEVKNVATAQRETEENLNVLIRTVQGILPRLPKQ